MKKNLLIFTLTATFSVNMLFALQHIVQYVINIPTFHAFISGVTSPQSSLFSSMSHRTGVTLQTTNNSEL